MHLDKKKRSIFLSFLKMENFIHNFGYSEVHLIYYQFLFQKSKSDILLCFHRLKSFYTWLGFVFHCWLTWMYFKPLWWLFMVLFWASYILVNFQMTKILIWSEYYHSEDMMLPRQVYFYLFFIIIIIFFLNCKCIFTLRFCHVTSWIKIIIGW